MTTLPEISALAAPELGEAIAQACRRIPPLWPLQSFVAVNPFLGLTDRSFADACALMERVTHGGMLMPAAYYRAQGARGVGDADLQRALDNSGAALSIKELRAWIERDEPVAAPLLPTVSESFDRWSGSAWTPFILDEVSKWCSAFYDAGQASWRMPWRDLPLFEAWRAVALRDANPEMMGLRGFRAFVAQLPDSATEFIASALDELGVRPDETVDFLHRQLMSIGGWSAYTQFLVREREMRGETDDALAQLLAIRLVHGLAIYRGAPDAFKRFWNQKMEAARAAHASPVSPAQLWQRAAEYAHQRQLIAPVRAAASQNQNQSENQTGRAAVQAAFCIDVRSELLRRHLEAAAPGIETIGFAGFFGFAIEYVPLGAQRGSAQCPALLLPKYRIESEVVGATPRQSERLLADRRFAKRLGRAWSSFKTSAISCFAFVETGGFLAGGKLVRASFNWPEPEPDALPTQPRVARENGANGSCVGIGLEDRIATALGALRGMSLTRDFARLVLICGHGSHTTNNPYASGLDCGACGGHSGEANARVAVAVFNDPLVRDGLRAAGVAIPDDTLFVAGLHNTTTDDVTLFDCDQAPAAHRAELEQLRAALALAGKQSRAERAASLGIASPDLVDQKVRARSRDWSQTRPEWGLAGNAAFIAAPRARTANVNLGGRAFLHNYNWRDDAQGAVLTAIMTAPMVVASWINLQYFASTVNNAQWGSGNKTIHNVVGTFGVWEGNAGDLQVGLPLQSVHDGHKFIHQPLRLSVLLEAPRAMIEAVIEANQSARDLVDNGWVLLLAIEDEGQTFWRYRGGSSWEKM